jgi:hypothetical protein
MATPKEPHYFAKDLHSPHYITEESKYLRLFDSAPKEAVRGEASVHYMFSNCALDNLLHHNPEIKIFILLRNPVELFRSWHAQVVYNGEEDIQDLEAAWGAQAARAEGRNLPVHLATSAKKLQYKDICAIGRQTAEFVSKVPKEQLLISLLEDLGADPEAFFHRATDFLSVDYHPFVKNDVINPSRRNRSDRLARAINWSRLVNSPTVRGLTPLFEKSGFHPLRLLRQLNTLPNHHADIGQQFRQQLIDAFSEDITILEEVLGQPLSHWRTPR